MASPRTAAATSTAGAGAAVGAVLEVRAALVLDVAQEHAVVSASGCGA